MQECTFKLMSQLWVIVLPTKVGQVQDYHGTTSHNSPHYTATKAQCDALQKLAKTMTRKDPDVIEQDENFMEEGFVQVINDHTSIPDFKAFYDDIDMEAIGNALFIPKPKKPYSYLNKGC